MYAHLPAPWPLALPDPSIVEPRTDAPPDRYGTFSAPPHEPAGRPRAPVPLHRLRGHPQRDLLRRAHLRDIELVRMASAARLHARARAAPGCINAACRAAGEIFKKVGSRSEPVRRPGVVALSPAISAPTGRFPSKAPSRSLFLCRASGQGLECGGGERAAGIVAGLAGEHDIVRSQSPSLRFWHHVVEGGEIGSTMQATAAAQNRHAAVDASALVAGKDRLEQVCVPVGPHAASKLPAADVRPSPRRGYRPWWPAARPTA